MITRVLVLLTGSWFLCTAALAQPANTQPAPAPADDTTARLMATISNWAGAWQSQLPDLYIAHYALDYKADGFATREAWVADRRERLRIPAWIKLRLIDFELVSITETEAVTRFTLIYERPDYQDQTYKELVLHNRNGLWLISAETNLEVTAL